MRVIIESPFAGKTEEESAKNEKYLNAALAHSLGLGEAPFASHGIYTRKGVLDDAILEERSKGIEAGFQWREVAEKSVFYGDLGVTSGMIMGLEHSISLGVPVTFRSLGKEWASTVTELGKFSERVALEWLCLHSDVKWKDKNRDGWMYHMAMMFGGSETDALKWNIRREGTARYIIYQGLIGSGRYIVDNFAVNHRLLELMRA